MDLVRHEGRAPRTPRTLAAPVVLVAGLLAFFASAGACSGGGESLTRA